MINYAIQIIIKIYIIKNDILLNDRSFRRQYSFQFQQNIHFNDNVYDYYRHYYLKTTFHKQTHFDVVQIRSINTNAKKRDIKIKNNKLIASRNENKRLINQRNINEQKIHSRKIKF